MFIVRRAMMNGDSLPFLTVVPSLISGFLLRINDIRLSSDLTKSQEGA